MSLHKLLLEASTDKTFEYGKVRNRILDLDAKFTCSTATHEDAVELLTLIRRHYPVLLQLNSGTLEDLLKDRQAFHKVINDEGVENAARSIFRAVIKSYQ